MASLEPIGLSELSASDLQFEAQVLGKRGIPCESYRVWPGDTRTPGQMLFIPEASRAGIVWGGAAAWTDAATAEEALSRWLTGDLID